MSTEERTAGNWAARRANFFHWSDEKSVRKERNAAVLAGATLAPSGSGPPPPPPQPAAARAAASPAPAQKRLTPVRRGVRYAWRLRPNKEPTKLDRQRLKNPLFSHGGQFRVDEPQGILGHQRPIQGHVHFRRE